jgi:arylsulfatase A-like enzyme
VVFVTVDAMRAELLARDEWRRRLPRFAALAAQSVEFTEARSPSSTTRNSLGQVFSSRYASQLRWGRTGRLANLLDDPTPRLTDRLRKAGFETIHLTVLAVLASRLAVIGEFEHEKRLKNARKGQRFPLSDAVVKEAQRVLREERSGPAFLYMHWLDAHDPYDAAGTEGTDFERYLREVELADKSLGKLIDELERRELWQRTILIVSADHGEALGDHGIPHHGGSIYETLVRVPLLIRVPGVPARRVDVPVTTLDIAPTLLDLLGLPTPGEYMGQSLVGFLRGERPRLERPIAIDEGRLKIYGLLIGSHKVIEDRRKHTVEIYDLAKDPTETNNLYGALPNGKSEQMLNTLRLFFETHSVRSEAVQAPDE